MLKPEYLRMIAGNAKVCASDFATGGVFRFDDASRLWTVIAELAEECASLSERIAVQENRRVGRPPKAKNEFSGVGE